MTRRHRVLGVFIGLCLAVFGTLAVVQWNLEFLFYGAVLIAEIAAVFWLDLRIRLSTPVITCLALWGALHLAGGTVPIPESVTEPSRPTVLYNLRIHPGVPKYDQVVHAFGFGVATLAAWEALRFAAGPRLRPTAGVLVLLLCAGMGLGAANEVIEFAATRIMPGTNVGGYDNTGWDLVSNMVGAAMAAAWIGVSGASGDAAGPAECPSCGCPAGARPRGV